MPNRDEAGSHGDSPRHFRLCGEVLGVDCSYTIRPGESLIGSREENHVVIAEPGVSRRHALLVSGPDGLVLEDLGSKNGTFLNGRRIERARVAPGDVLRFAGVRLRLEEVEPSDAQLAITVDTPPVTPDRDPRDSRPTGTAAGLESGQIDAWSGAMEPFLVAVQSARRDRLATALAALVKGLRGSGACCFELAPGGQPVVLATAGRPLGVMESAELREALSATAQARRAGEVEVLLLERPSPGAFALLPGRDGASLGLLLVGDYPGRSHSAAFLRCLMRVLADRPTASSDPADEASPPPLPGLIFPSGYVVGISAAMESLHRQMRPLAQGDLPVLIVGETGVGKEHIAEILHASSPRSGGPFVAINCAAIPSELLEAELFGIGRGVATGVTEREGSFQAAQGGVVFLDEIADMAPHLQSKLLRVLQEKQVHPVGGRHPVAVDVGVIAATNAEPHRLLEEGRIRPDLYFRIAGSVLAVPPLRERSEDIPALVEHFIRRFSAATRKPVRGITVKALAALAAYRWPGNVRELQHEVQRLVYLCPPDQAITSTLLADRVARPEDEPSGATASGDGSLRLDLHSRELERRLIREALERTGGNRTRAADLLGISRNGLAIKMRRLGLSG